MQARRKRFGRCSPSKAEAARVLGTPIACAGASPVGEAIGEPVGHAFSASFVAAFSRAFDAEGALSLSFVRSTLN
jgi:hypothetical protein